MKAWRRQAHPMPATSARPWAGSRRRPAVPPLARSPPGSSPRPFPAPTSRVTTRSTEPPPPRRQGPTTPRPTSADPASTQSPRRDAGRLVAASAALALAMSVILGLDFLPAQEQLEVAKPAPANVVAPRTVEY